MKKAVSAAIIFLIVASLAAPVYCEGNAVKKLGRGLSNAITFPFEIPLQMSRVNNTDGAMAGLTYGLLKGVGMAGLRALTGVYETITFPIPFPQKYEPILTDPEFIFEEKNW